MISIIIWLLFIISLLIMVLITQNIIYREKIEEMQKFYKEAFYQKRQLWKLCNSLEKTNKNLLYWQNLVKKDLPVLKAIKRHFKTKK